MDLTLREIIDRYGPTIALIVALIVLVALFPARRGSEESEITSGQGPTTEGGSASGFTDLTPGDSTDAGDLGGTGGAGGSGDTGGFDFGGSGGSGAIATGGGAAAQFGEKVCRSDGRMPGMSRIMPPCIGKFIGNNGGATARGVAGDSFTIVRYIAQANAATQAALIAAGADDTPEDQDRMDRAIIDYFAHHYETYGRAPKYVVMNASGPTNDQVQRRDALTIEKTHKAFIVYGAPNTLAEELAARGIICICTTSLSDRFYAKTKGFIFSSLPSAEEYYAAAAEYLGKRLKNGGPEHAGVGTSALPKRKFGLLWLEATSSGPVRFAKEGKDFFMSEMKNKYGITDVKAVGYNADLAQAQEQTTNVISQFVSAEVTTIALAADPLFPIFLTKEATRQRYFPEWIILGTALTDTTFFGRTYDQAQWGNAFGISPLWVFWVDVSTSSGYREYHHARPGSNRGDEGVSINVRRAPIQWIFQGVMMAGPKLTPQTFAQGMYNFPRSGGAPDTPLVFFTPKYPNAIKDWTEVWWKVDGNGRDETGKDGPGTLMKVDGGKRYLTGKFPTTKPKVFVNQGAIYTKDFLDAPKHEQDGHTHDYAKQKCLSCPKK